MTTQSGIQYHPTEKKQGYFAQIPIVIQRECNPYELAVYTNIKQLIGTNDRDFFKSHKTIASETQMGVTTVKRCIKSLIQKGFIAITKVEKGRTNHIDLVDVYELNGQYANADEAVRQFIIQQYLAHRELGGSSQRARLVDEPSPQRATNNNYIKEHSKEKQKDHPPTADNASPKIQTSQSDKKEASPLIELVPQTHSDQHTAVMHKATAQDLDPEPPPPDYKKIAGDNFVALSAAIPDIMKIHHARARDLAHILSGTSKKFKHLACDFNVEAQQHVTPDELRQVVAYYQSENPEWQPMEKFDTISNWIGKYRSHEKQKVADRDMVTHLTNEYYNALGDKPLTFAKG